MDFFRHKFGGLACGGGKIQQPGETPADQYSTSSPTINVEEQPIKDRSTVWRQSNHQVNDNSNNDVCYY